jgi:hypothetical protein
MCLACVEAVKSEAERNRLPVRRNIGRKAELGELRGTVMTLNFVPSLISSSLLFFLN